MAQTKRLQKGITQGLQSARELVSVIQTTNRVESLMKRAISAYFKIDKERVDFFEAYLLNNAAINFAGKLKIIKSINDRERLIASWRQSSFIGCRT